MANSFSNKNKPTPPVQEFSSWRNSQLFAGISESDLNNLAGHLLDKTYAPGDYIIKEGMYGDAVFFIEKGSVEIRKDGVKLGERKAGDYIGAMALMENTTRSANAIALESTQTKVLTINQLKAIESDEIFRDVLTNQLKQQQQLVRQLTDTTIQESKAKLVEAESRVQLANFFFYLILILLLYQFILGMYIEYKEFLRQGFYRGIITPGFIFFATGAGILIAKKIGIPFAYLGLTLKNWRANLREALIWTAGFIIFVIGLKWVLIQTIPAFSDRAVFESFMLDDSLTPAMLIFYNFIYAIMTPLQEFITRGILQGSLCRILTGKYVVFQSILLSNLIFSALHLHIDLKFALLTIIPGFFWGYMYDRQKSILGVSVSHLIIGMFFFLVLGNF